MYAVLLAVILLHKLFTVSDSLYFLSKVMTSCSCLELSRYSLHTFGLFVMLISMYTRTKYLPPHHKNSQHTFDNNNKLISKDLVFQLYTGNFVRSYFPKSLHSTLLLLSGDVELNPGPPKKIPSTPKPKAVQAEYSVADGGSRDQPLQLMDDSATVQNVEPFQTQSGESSIKDTEATSTGVGQVNSTIDEPQAGIASTGNDPDKTLLVTGASNELRDTSQASTESGEGNIMPRVGQRNSFINGERQTGTAKTESREDPKLTSPQLNSSHQVRQGEKSEVEILLSELRGKMTEWFRRDLWKRDEGFLTNDKSVLKEFYMIANKLFRLGRGCDLCALCGRKKDLSGGPCESHIFSKCLLILFKQFHCDGESEFMFDFSRGKRLGTNLTCKLLCDKCEKEGSKCEQKLKQVYGRLKDDSESFSKPNTVYNFEIENEGMWFQFILANFMFRGLLINLDLEDSDESLWEKIFCLRDYCNQISFYTQNLIELRLFLLPNCPIIHDKVDDFTRPAEWLIRNPRFTDLCRLEEGGLFLYTQFDCFHILYLLNDKCVKYFKDHVNGLSLLESGNWCLSWTHPLDVHATSLNTGAVVLRVPDDAWSRCFPHVLLKKNVDLYTEYISMIYTDHGRLKPKLDTGVKSYIVRSPGLNYSYPHNPRAGHSAKISFPPIVRSDFHLKIDEKTVIRSEEMKLLVQRVAEKSPLKHVDGKVKQAQKVIQNLTHLLSCEEKKVEQLKGDRVEKEKRITSLVKENSLLTNQLEESQIHTEELTERVKYLERIVESEIRTGVEKTRIKQSKEKEHFKCTRKDVVNPNVNEAIERIKKDLDITHQTDIQLDSNVHQIEQLMWRCCHLTRKVGLAVDTLNSSLFPTSSNPAIP